MITSKKRKSTICVLLLIAGGCSHSSHSPNPREIAQSSRTKPTKNVSDPPTSKDSKEPKSFTLTTGSIRDIKPTALSFSPNGKFLAVGYANTITELWSVPDWKIIRTLKSTDDLISTDNALTFLPKSDILVVGTGRSVKAWVVQTGQVNKTVAQYPDIRNLGVWILAVSMNGDFLATSSFDRKLIVWDTKTWKPNQTIVLPEVASSLSFAPNSKALLVGSYDLSVRVWSIATGKKIETIKEGAKFRPTKVLGTLAIYSPDKSHLAISIYKQPVTIWNFKIGKVVHQLNHSYLHSIVFSSDGTLLATGGLDQYVNIWRVYSGKTLLRLKVKEGAINAVAFSPDKKWFAIATRYGVHIYGLQDILV